jgi:hypothetical protein
VAAEPDGEGLCGERNARGVREGRANRRPFRRQGVLSAVLNPQRWREPGAGYHGGLSYPPMGPLLGIQIGQEGTKE